MKNIFFALFVVVGFTCCNSQEQTSTVGNSEDSSTVKGTDTIYDQGAVLDSSAGTAGTGIIKDTANGKTDSLDKTTRKKKALRK